MRAMSTWPRRTAGMLLLTSVSLYTALLIGCPNGGTTPTPGDNTDGDNNTPGDSTSGDTTDIDLATLLDGGPTTLVTSNEPNDPLMAIIANSAGELQMFGRKNADGDFTQVESMTFAPSDGGASSVVMLDEFERPTLVILGDAGVLSFAYSGAMVTLTYVTAEGETETATVALSELLGGDELLTFDGVPAKPFEIPVKSSTLTEASTDGDPVLITVAIEIEKQLCNGSFTKPSDLLVFVNMGVPIAPGLIDQQRRVAMWNASGPYAGKYTLQFVQHRDVSTLLREECERRVASNSARIRRSGIVAFIVGLLCQNGIILGTMPELCAGIVGIGGVATVAGFLVDEGLTANCANLDLPPDPETREIFINFFSSGGAEILGSTDTVLTNLNSGSTVREVLIQVESNDTGYPRRYASTGQFDATVTPNFGLQQGATLNQAVDVEVILNADGSASGTISGEKVLRTRCPSGSDPGGESFESDTEFTTEWTGTHKDGHFELKFGDRGEEFVIEGTYDLCELSGGATDTRPANAFCTDSSLTQNQTLTWTFELTRDDTGRSF